MSEEPEYLEMRLREALASDPRVGTPGLEVRVRGRSVQVSGRVETERQCEGVRGVVAEVLPGYDLRSHLEVAAVRPPPEGEEEQL